ncbi:MAG TPA: PqqD family protein [Vicinamibacterales bacterium]|jgi:hypothetical protein
MSVFAIRSDRIAARKVGGEMVILSADDSSVFVLNEVGTFIWESSDGRTTLDAIINRMCEEFDVDRDTARQDAAAFVESLSAAGLLSTSPDAAL